MASDDSSKVPVEFRSILERHVAGFSLDEDAQRLIWGLLGNAARALDSAGVDREKLLFESSASLDKAMSVAAEQFRESGNYAIDGKALARAMRGMCPLPPFRGEQKADHESG